MKIKHTVIILTGICLALNYGCSLKWSEAIRSGNVAQKEFNETVDIDIQQGLIFVPVTIRGKQYRFLFDSGAPFSISDQLQNEYNFEIVSQGNIIDSDKNRKKVNWARISPVKIGNVTFTDQTAFIGDFEANPLLKCLAIDGIIGSNLMRHCNWAVDQQKKSLSLFSKIDEQTLKESVIIPFKTDDQYNVFIDLNIGRAALSNILMDFGSNGSISLNEEIFGTLENKKIISEPLLERGTQQSGIIGQAVNLSRRITYTDSVRIKGISLKNVMLRTGKTSSVGNDFLSRFWITIDWKNKKLYVAESGKIPDSNTSTGFKLGYSREKGAYIQSVIENSVAYKKGVRPNMKVVKIDSLNFNNTEDFCRYLKHETGDRIILLAMDSNGKELEFHIDKTTY